MFVEGGACAMAQWHNGQSKPGRQCSVEHGDVANRDDDGFSLTSLFMSLMMSDSSHCQNRTKPIDISLLVMPVRSFY